MNTLTRVELIIKPFNARWVGGDGIYDADKLWALSFWWRCKGLRSVYVTICAVNSLLVEVALMICLNVSTRLVTAHARILAANQ